VAGGGDRARKSLVLYLFSLQQHVPVLSLPLSLSLSAGVEENEPAGLFFKNIYFFENEYLFSNAQSKLNRYPFRLGCALLNGYLFRFGRPFLSADFFPTRLPLHVD